MTWIQNPLSIITVYCIQDFKQVQGFTIVSSRQKLIDEEWAVSISTFNKRLNFLRGYFNWLMDKGDIEDNPLGLISKEREKKKNPRRISLSEQEIQSFHDAIKNNIFCHKSSPVKHSYYYPFLKFVFITGVRNAEANGLRMKHIDFKASQIEISEAFVRSHRGTKLPHI